MRFAVQERKIKKDLKENIGKPKLNQEYFTEDGLTEIKPFQLYTDSRPDRLKAKR
jgi:hypothetical protein